MTEPRARLRAAAHGDRPVCDVVAADRGSDRAETAFYGAASARFMEGRESA